MSEAAYPIAVSGRRLRLLKAFALVVMLVSLAHAGLFLLTGLPIRNGTSGLGLAAAIKVDRGYIRVDAVAPDGAAARARLRAGDWVRFDRPADIHRLRVWPGEQFGVTVRTGDSLRRTTLTAPPARLPRLRAETVLSGVTSMLLALAGGVIAVRSPRLSGVILGGALAAMALLGTYTFLWENHPAIQIPLTVLFSVIMGASPVLLIAFALTMRRETFGRPIGAVSRVALWSYAGLQASLVVTTFHVGYTFRILPLVGDTFLLSVLAQWGGFLFALILLLTGWREAVGAERTRFGLLFIALAMLFMAGNGTGLLINLTGNDFSLNNPVAVAGQVFMVGGIAAFLYASLRHKVIDLGFAVNRTLVFGALSTALLFAFFFLEWGAEQIIPADMREASLLASAGIAFVLFLIFHKVRDWVEKGVETLFFRQWRNKETELRRFMRQAAFVTRAEMLRASAVAAFSRFADGADVALYRREGDVYVRAEGAVPGLDAKLDPDTAALVRLRAQLEPLEDDLPGGATLLLPLIQRKDVTGFFAFGPKPAGELYRPDEREALAEAAARVGLDLHALRVEALEIESREQRRRADMLERQMQRALKAGARA